MHFNVHDFFLALEAARACAEPPTVELVCYTRIPPFSTDCLLNRELNMPRGRHQSKIVFLLLHGLGTEVSGFSLGPFSSVCALFITKESDPRCQMSSSNFLKQ
jgi:hypothetical protein